MSHGREGRVGREALHELGQRSLAQLLVALFAAGLMLVFVQCLAAIEIPGVDSHVQAVQSLTELEYRPTGFELDVLGIDHAFEVARAERVERFLDVLELLATERLRVELPPSYGRVVTGPHDPHLAATLTAGLASSVELEGDRATGLAGVTDDLQWFTGVVLRIDVPLVQQLTTGTKLDEVDSRPLVPHADLELGADQMLQVVEVDRADDSVRGDPFDPDHCAPRRVVPASRLHELAGDLRQSTPFFVRDVNVILLGLDLSTDERPDVGVTSLAGWGVRLAREDEAVALVERRDQAQAKTAETPSSLDPLADTVQSFLESVFRDPVAIVESDDQASLSVDPDVHRPSRSVDGVLNGLDNRQRQRWVLVGQPEERLPYVRAEPFP